jgi:hypothetical protein
MTNPPPPSVHQAERALTDRLRSGVYGIDRIALCVEAADEIDRLRASLATPAPLADAPDSANWHKGGVTLTARQLRNALDLVAPDWDSDEDQRATEATIAWTPDGMTTDDDGNAMPAGYRAWLTEYPEEGSIPLLDEYAAPSPSISAAAPAVGASPATVKESLTVPQPPASAPQAVAEPALVALREALDWIDDQSYSRNFALPVDFEKWRAALSGQPAERCPCGYPQPCSRTVPVTFCRQPAELGAR